MALENILEITTAIRSQKERRIVSLPKIAEDFSSKESSFPDLGSKIKVMEEDKKDSFTNKDVEEAEEKAFIRSILLGKGEKVLYSPFNLFSQYVSAFKDKFYGYYSRVKDAIKKSGFNAGYTDKLLKEIEDWGTVYFRTVFRNLHKLTPMGAITRYLEELWIFIPKKVKY